MLLNEYKLDIDRKTANGYTPLHLAAQTKNIECLIELMKLGANSTLCDKHRRDVLDFLCEVSPKLNETLKYGFGEDGKYILKLVGEKLKIIGEFKEFDITSLLKEG